MFAVTVAFIVIVTLVFIGYPLIRRGGERSLPRTGEGDSAQLRAHLAELEMDLHLGHISEEEYRRLCSECEQMLRKRGEDR